MDDQRVGASLRAIRIRRRLRQTDVSSGAGIPRRVAILIESGRLEQVRFGDIRAYARALGAGFDGSILWQGADLDRMLNRGHARLHEAVTAWLADVGGWLAVPEVSFSYSGERGVIDIVAWHAATRTILIVELKTRIVDISDLMTTMDIRARMASGSPTIVDGLRRRSGCGSSLRQAGQTPASWPSTRPSSGRNSHRTAGSSGAGWRDRLAPSPH